MGPLNFIKKIFFETTSQDPYKKLMNTSDEKSTEKIKELSLNRFNEFKAIFKLFEKKIPAEDLAGIVGKKITRDLTQEKYLSLYEYLTCDKFNEESKKEGIPIIYEWIANANEETSPMLLEIISWDLFDDLGCAQDDNGTLYVGQASELEELLKHSPEDFKKIFNLLKQTPYQNRKALITLLYDIQKELNKKTSTLSSKEVDLLSIFEELKKKDLGFFILSSVIHEKIGIEKILSLSTEDLKKIATFRVAYSGQEHYFTALKQAESQEEFKILLAMPEEVYQLIQTVPYNNQNWDHYVVRMPGWKNAYGGSSQEEYGALMHQAVQRATLCRKEKNWNCEEMLDFLAKQRRIIGYRLVHPQRTLTGILRSPNDKARTYCNTIYQKVSDRLWQKINEQKNDSYLQIKDFDGKTAKLTFIGKINGKSIELSKIDFRETYKDESLKKLVETKIEQSREKCTLLTHTSQENAVLVMSHVKKTLYPEACAINDQNKLNKKLGEIFWWICQAKPWNIGDPSIAELLIRSVWQEKGLESPAWKVGIIPWEEVSVEPDMEIFSQKFHTFFEWQK